MRRILPAGDAGFIHKNSPEIVMKIIERLLEVLTLKNPALVTIPLSFALGIVVSLLTADPVAVEKYAQVERQMHLGQGG